MQTTATPTYLSELEQTHVPPRALCSSNAPTLVVSCIHTKLHCRTFYVAAPSTWNSLPADIRLCENILTFKRHLKTLNAHISLLFSNLSIFKVNECIEYKLLSLTYKVLTTSQPSYAYNKVESRVVTKQNLSEQVLDNLAYAINSIYHGRYVLYE